MLSIKELHEETIIKNIKLKLKNKLSLINKSLGEKTLKPKRKITLTKTEIKLTKLKHVFILLFLSLDLGKYLIKPKFKPKTEKEVIKAITEIIEVVNPISSVEYNLAIIIQKTKPKKDITSVLVIK